MPGSVEPSLPRSKGWRATFWLSMFAAIMLLVAWTVSWWRWDAITAIPRDGATITLANSQGSVSLESIVICWPAPRAPLIEMVHQSGSPPIKHIYSMGDADKLSHWALIIIAAAIAAFAEYQSRIPMRAKSSGICTRCRYDLRAHSSGDKCPECGTPIPSKASTIVQERTPP